MINISTIETHGVTYRFEPPVVVRDDDGPSLSLELLATRAWIGPEIPGGITKELTESGLVEEFEDLEYDPKKVVEAINKVLEGKHVVTVE